LINGLLADPQFRLFEAVFPQDSSAVLIAMTPLDPPGFGVCIQGALAVCGVGNVCSVCFVDTPQQTICSFIWIATGHQFTACVSDAMYWCDQSGGQSICSFCFIAMPDGTFVCSYICGNPSAPGGCTPPPCPRPICELRMDPLAPVDQSD